MTTFLREVMSVNSQALEEDDEEHDEDDEQI